MSMNKKRIILTFTLIMALASASFAYGAAVPSDVAGASYEAAVSALMDKGIITGDTNGNFNPDTTLTRAQACVIIVKTMNPPAAEVTGTATQPAAKSDFTDMTGYGWAEGYISYAVKHGVTKGYPDGTFKPGNPVTMNELVTMVLRAAAYTDESLGGTWPSNYMGKAIELNVLKGTPETDVVYASKWMAAQIDYNALDQIEKANPQQQTPSDSQATPAGVPDTSTMTYVTGSFNSAMSTFNGKTLADNVKIYTYGKKASFSSTMTFSKKAADYRLETVYKYKNVETSAFYQVENGKIVTMVIPKDVGFSGLAYVVINETYTSTNAKGDSVTGLKTLAAGKEIKWLCEKGLTVPSKAEYLGGTLYELKLKDGAVTGINKTTDPHRGDVFNELSGTAFIGIDDYSNNVVSLTGGDKTEIKDNATIYVMNAANPTEYKIGKQADIKDGNQIRVYDMSDDDNGAGDIVVVLAD